MYANFMDNFFSTPLLLLREKSIAACRTVRSNAKEFPASLAVRGSRDRKMNWNMLGAEICANGIVLALTWIENGAVQMISTMHEFEDGHCVEKL